MADATDDDSEDFDFDSDVLHLLEAGHILSNAPTPDMVRHSIGGGDGGGSSSSTGGGGGSSSGGGNSSSTSGGGGGGGKLKYLVACSCMPCA
jgi:hypothetical protein